MGSNVSVTMGATHGSEDIQKTPPTPKGVELHSLGFLKNPRYPLEFAILSLKSSTPHGVVVYTTISHPPVAPGVTERFDGFTVENSNPRVPSEK